MLRVRVMYGGVCAFAAFVLAGCAIHPLPEDVTGVDTYTIVRQIRCETRQAVIDFALRWLGSESEDRVDPASRARTALFTTPLVTAHPVTSSEASAAEAVSQFLTLKLFRPTVTVVQ